MQLQRNASRFMLSIFVDGATPVHDGNPNPRAEFAHRCRKIDMLIVHDEAKDASPHTAAKAVEGLPLRADGKRRRLLLVERTERLEICAGAFERKIGADHLDDIARRGDLL